MIHVQVDNIKQSLVRYIDDTEQKRERDRKKERYGGEDIINVTLLLGGT